MAPAPTPLRRKPSELSAALMELGLLMLFFVVIVPLGYLLRLGGYDPLKLKRQNTQSYWQPRSDVSNDRESLKRQGLA